LVGYQEPSQRPVNSSQQQASSEGRTDEDATNGVLVVQVRHLGTIFRDVFQFAGREAFVTGRERDSDSTPSNSA